MPAEITVHPNIRRVMAQFEALELHAARAGREVADALAQAIRESAAATSQDLMVEFEAALDALLSVMLPYAPPLNAMHRFLTVMERELAAGSGVDQVKVVMQFEADRLAGWSVEARVRTARLVGELITDDATVFTFTLSETTLRGLKEAKRLGRNFRVLVTESRPNHDGLVTASELARLGVPVSVSIDACLAALLRRADLMIVGAEAILFDGSAVCKVGTYPAALVARQFAVPVYVVVDTLKFSVASLAGLSQSLDPLSRFDVFASMPGSRPALVGHLFDRTPPELIRGIVTEDGIFSPQAAAARMLEMPVSETLNHKLAQRVLH